MVLDKTLALRFELSIIVAMEIQTNQLVKHQAPPTHLSVMTLSQNAHTHTHEHPLSQALLMWLSGELHRLNSYEFTIAFQLHLIRNHFKTCIDQGWFFQVRVIKQALCLK